MSGNCLDFFQTINEDVRDEMLDSIHTNIESTFRDNISYYVVNKNYDYTNEYDAIITDVSDWREKVSRKKIIMYPGQTITSGDYIHWDYGGEITDWLVLSTDKQYDFQVSGEIKQTNNILKWYASDGSLKSWRCVSEYKMNETAFDYSRYMTVANGLITVYVQRNDDTNAIDIDQRFILDGIAFRVQQRNRTFSAGLVVLMLQFDTVHAGDDLVNNIANALFNQYSISIDQNDFEASVGNSGTLSATIKDGDEVVSGDVEWISSDPSVALIDSSGNYSIISNGIANVSVLLESNNDISDSISITVSASPLAVKQNIIMPQIEEILQGDSQTFTVHKYTNNVQQADTFAISATGVPASYYNLTIIDGNSFSVENILRYDNSSLVVTCVNNIDASVTNINLKLAGRW